MLLGGCDNLSGVEGVSKPEFKQKSVKNRHSPTIKLLLNQAFLGIWPLPLLCSFLANVELFLLCHKLPSVPSCDAIIDSFSFSK